MLICTLQQKQRSAEQIRAGAAVVQNGSLGVTVSHQLNMIQQHPVPEKKTTVVLDYMNRNAACEICDVVLLHVVGECLSWNMVSSCRQNASWKMWSSWGQAEKSSERDARLGLFEDDGRDVFKSVRAAKAGEINSLLQVGQEKHIMLQQETFSSTSEWAAGLGSRKS